ncbi:protein MICROTUBULE BINDING PROTEIN 2C-like [Hibiscus syriacus]|uniref:protein MICROTUBULE BINDING PROTEIN 2C-like n=1 Tax=Hibiscus syriacus TaxID=106335 RepID=UPI00192061DC|nr:protein MICROTUBULE BINDING PROTEIN 2C-like [Hibiscus syriacus]
MREQINDVQAELDQLNRVAAEKDSLINSIQLRLYDAKMKLADKQAALDSMRGEFSSFVPLLNGLTKNTRIVRVEDYDVASYHLEHLIYIDDEDDRKIPKIEEARRAYAAALDAAKEKQDEESLAAELMQGYISNL